MSGCGKVSCLALLVLLFSIGLGLAEDGKGRIEGQVMKDDEGVGAVVVLISELKITQVTEKAPEALRKYARPGDVPWSVGNKDVTSRREVVQGVVERCDFIDKYRKLGGHPLKRMVSVGMVVGSRRDYMAGTNTQGLAIPRTEVDAMREWLANQPNDD